MRPRPLPAAILAAMLLASPATAQEPEDGAGLSGEEGRQAALSLSETVDHLIAELDAEIDRLEGQMGFGGDAGTEERIEDLMRRRDELMATRSEIRALLDGKEEPEQP